jgi:ketosteroid isomerase-like protein
MSFLTSLERQAIMPVVTHPSEINRLFADGFNRRDHAGLLSLYEEGAVLRTDARTTFAGRAQIARALEQLLGLPGTMRSINRYCIEHDGIALLRADYAIVRENGDHLLSGSSAEVVRRQTDGSWLYVIDHATGASSAPDLPL